MEGRGHMGRYKRRWVENIKNAFSCRNKGVKTGTKLNWLKTGSKTRLG
jgi:hypothetical protein